MPRMKRKGLGILFGCLVGLTGVSSLWAMPMMDDCQGLGPDDAIECMRQALGVPESEALVVENGQALEEQHPRLRSLLGWEWENTERRGNRGLWRQHRLVSHL